MALSDSNPQTKALLSEIRKTKTESLLSLAKTKLPPAAHGAVSALAGMLPATGTISLSDGKQTTGFDLVKDILNAIPDQVLTQEVIGLSDPDSGKTQEPVSAAKMMGCI